ncbi:type II secretion system F family protein [Sulfitobacter mediterraneus]|uniref:type II secretion system F family protein n=1 Tax=Sulfitobacter mediterraneus TaxID=83219 RepID=UPI0019330C28|nr:type II secretion system F family protein [Sulfitobacter mediterraneus]MBM1631258.1 type II secretion system F family protein [Sulfitobacter mediterraneus]MBM1639071.1 type II secretion system F family protein [Sulfitobacter mediterraneus]MBM1643120.1 type II secretion system F family protein [Sulfitobacter mediterraneus]MBM1647168.1 type II secretion system F family protein [Sulfitobacter mediterraneus]MBM1651211.1 type II secretion system F family protein [Sulfitobacter mediterraneus]
MEFLQELDAQLGGLGLVIGAGVIGFLMIVTMVVMILRQPEDPLNKLKRTSASPSGQDKAKRLRQSEGNEQLQKFAKFLEPEDVAELSAKQLMLRQAGYQSRDAVRMFYFAQMALGLIGLLGGVVYTNFLGGGEGLSTQKTMMWTIGPGAIGYYLPKYWVTRRVEARKEEITRGFPDALDMMLVCVEAGQSLDQCIVRVAKELRASYQALSEEFEVVAYEMKAGKDKITVLNDMGERCGVQDVSSFVTVLVQSAAFGTSIADALRVYAGEMRDKRVMRAEEAANKLPTKMTLATMMLTVPPLLIILVGPSVHGITELGKISGPGQ